MGEIYSYQNARTQKAKGVLALATGTARFPRLSMVGQGTMAMPRSVRILPYQDPPPLPVFARPCPTRPRHGFVDSQLITTYRQLCGIVHKLAREDPEGELLLMPPLTAAKYSAVLNASGIAFGRGNDGATAGKKSIFIPTPCDRGHWMRSTTPLYDTSADIGIHTEAYVEAVQAYERFMAVQLRDGPQSIQDSNFIPEKVEVTAVLRPKEVEGIDGVSPDALLAWEMAVAQALPGTVVYLPGATLASHYAVHAICRGLPVVTEGPAPQVGQTLYPKKKSLRLDAAQLRRLADLTAYWCTRPLSQGEQGHMQTTAIAAAAALHSMGVWSGTLPFLTLRAFAVATIARLTLTACLGEARHFYFCGPGRPYCLASGSWTPPEEVPLAERMEQTGSERLHTIPWGRLGAIGRKDPNGQELFIVPVDRNSARWIYDGEVARISREGVFDEGLRLPLLDLIALAPYIIRDLDGPGWSSSYGGTLWAEAARHALATLNLLRAFICDPTEGNWSAVVTSVNALLNRVHNGGAILTKWASTHHLSGAQQLPQVGLASPAAADVVLNFAATSKAAAGARKVIRDASLEAVVEMWRTPWAPEGELPPVEKIEVECTVADAGEVEEEEPFDPSDLDHDLDEPSKTPAPSIPDPAPSAVPVVEGWKPIDFGAAIQLANVDAKESDNG